MIETLTNLEVERLLALDRAAAYRRVYVDQLEWVKTKVKPNCPGGKYSGKQCDYIRAEASRLALDILDAFKSSEVASA